MANGQQKFKPGILPSIFGGIVIVLLIVGTFAPSYVKYKEREIRAFINMIEKHFGQLETEGFDVTYSVEYWGGKVNQEYGSLVTSETHIWKVKESDESEWVEYIWELHPVNEESMRLLESRGIPADGWWESTEGIDSQGETFTRDSRGIRTILLPMTTAALEFHLNKNLRLPKDYTLE